MTLDDEAFDGLLAGMNETAASETETVAAEPDQESPPSLDASAPEAEASPTETAAAPEPVKPDWDSADNPYRDAAIRQQALEAAAERVRLMQQQQQLQGAITELADGDADRQAQIYGVIDQIAQPLQQQAQLLEQRASSVEKAQVALWLAARAEFGDEKAESLKPKFQELMAADSPELMERIAFSERNVSTRFQADLAAKEQEIAELKRQLGAKAMLTDRAGRGADLVDAGHNGAHGQTPGNPADFGDWFDSTFDAFRARRSA